MPTKKERREALGRMTKAELVKTVVALDARQAKLLNEVTHAKEVAEAHSAVAVALQRQVQSLQGRLDNAHATATGAALSEQVLATGSVDNGRFNIEIAHEGGGDNPLPWEQE